MLRSPFFSLLIFIVFLCCKEKTTISIKPNFIKKEAKFLQGKALNNLQNKNFNSAFYYFNKSKILFESLKDSSNIAYSLIQMASIQQINGDYYGSKETLTEALPFVKNDYNYSAAINNYFGIADKELSIYDDAVYYYKEAIRNVSGSVIKQAPLNNIAVVYIKQKKYDKAITLLESILDNKILDDPLFIKNKARRIDNLGFAYFKKGIKSKGLQLMNDGLKLRKQADDSYGSIESYLHLSEYFSETNRKKSNQYAQNAYQVATKFNSIDERLKALSFLISNDSDTKYAQKYIVLNDSIIKIRNNFKNKFAKIKYDSKKEKDENQKLRLEKAENLVALKDAENQKIIFVAAFIVLLFLIAYFKKHSDNRNRIEKIKIAYDTETRIAKDIHDELANDVFNIITYTQTQPLESENKKETLIQKLDHIYSRVRGISRENNDIDTGTNYSANLKETLSTYNSDTRNVIINSIEKINWDDLDKIKKITIYRILQELMVNMKKHSEASVVVIKFDNSQKKIFIDYTDNGKGCDQNEIIKNGLQNMENRILATKGTITFETEPDRGFKVKISMPK
ncbi:tetratricopeptide repeat-containing sensor histidine kinase [Flavobacterium sp. CF136]|uniref:tetratricopeptide repeat-containing sensor histidine kinase n=1 Tax=Flavobacterium sp. (strain CF136) TaxID=1144313 RepID=UPI0002717CEB|nr:ATP-binding protein [Flavobacterium sp. CF136]EJL60562.1 histidine kinase [Flavobacterium sp. CF136]